MTGQANWSDGVMGVGLSRDLGRSSNSEFRSPNTPILHYSNYPLTYSANAARQSRIGGKPSCSESKQRSGV